MFLTKQTKTTVMNASSPAQAPTTAKNAINAEDNLPAGNGFAQPPWNAEGSKEPASNDPAQHSVLPPFVQHDAINAAVNPPVGNEDIIVGDYHIDGVADIIGVESRPHVTAFYEAIIPLIEKASQSNRLMIKSKFELIKEALLRNREGDESITELRSEFHKSISGIRRMLLLSMEGNCHQLCEADNIF